MEFADFVCFEAVVPQLNATDRDGVIAELVDALDNAGQLGKKKPKDIVRAVIKREKEASTGIGKGVAVPHVKLAAIKNAVAVVGRSHVGIDFSALDKQPVYSVILLLSPLNEPDHHLQVMECIFKHLQLERFRKFLRQSETAEAIEDLLREVELNPTLE
ncbi:MAG: PTS sugar transporter subunit IIA [Planctomycetota bacterium]|jgi:mannitol/fructose-specific phosphotransferase system IIA component (Ntr-type)